MVSMMILTKRTLPRRASLSTLSDNVGGCSGILEGTGWSTRFLQVQTGRQELEARLRAIQLHRRKDEQRGFILKVK